MKYQFSETNKRKVIKRNRTFMTIQYGMGAIVILYILIVNWSNSGIELKLPLLGGLIILPFAWIYFDKNLHTKISTTYEVYQRQLIIKENETVKHNISLDKIQYLKKIPSGYRIETGREGAHIINGIENKDELLKTINKPIR